MRFEPSDEFRTAHHALTAAATEFRVSEDPSPGDGPDETDAIHIRNHLNHHDRGAGNDCQNNAEGYDRRMSRQRSRDSRCHNGKVGQEKNVPAGITGHNAGQLRA